VAAKCDVFSFGLVLCEISTDKPAFHPSELPLPVMKRWTDRRIGQHLHNTLFWSAELCPLSIKRPDSGIELQICTLLLTEDGVQKALSRVHTDHFRHQYPIRYPVPRSPVWRHSATSKG
jgi:hypothetical protein